MKYVITVIAALIISGCTTLEKVTDYVTDNPSIVNISAKVAVYKYCDKGATVQKQIERAERLVNKLSGIMSYLDDGFATTKTKLLDALLDNVDASDRLMIKEFVGLVIKNEDIDTDQRIIVLGLLEISIEAAKDYINDKKELFQGS